MSLVRLQSALVASWFMALLFVFGLRVAMGTSPAAAPGLGVLLLACLPPAVLLIVFRGAPADGLAQPMYETAHASEQPIPAMVQGPGVVRSTATSAR